MAASKGDGSTKVIPGSPWNISSSVGLPITINQTHQVEEMS
jgi:hypothetical protein